MNTTHTTTIIIQHADGTTTTVTITADTATHSISYTQATTKHIPTTPRDHKPCEDRTDGALSYFHDYNYERVRAITEYLHGNGGECEQDDLTESLQASLELTEQELDALLRAARKAGAVTVTDTVKLSYTDTGSISHNGNTYDSIAALEKAGIDIKARADEERDLATWHNLITYLTYQHA